MFDNLFANAVKYRRLEKSNIQISLKRTMESTDIELVFQDDGPGVPLESLDKYLTVFTGWMTQANGFETDIAFDGLEGEKKA